MGNACLPHYRNDRLFNTCLWDLDHLDPENHNQINGKIINADDGVVAGLEKAVPDPCLYLITVLLVNTIIHCIALTTHRFIPETYCIVLLCMQFDEYSMVDHYRG